MHDLYFLENESQHIERKKQIAYQNKKKNSIEVIGTMSTEWHVHKWSFSRFLGLHRHCFHSENHKTVAFEPNHKVNVPTGNIFSAKCKQTMED